MRWVSRVLLVALSVGLMAQVPEGEVVDPVLRARKVRAAAQGISERELPPVTQGLVDPPPLPPPETHVRDTPGYRRVKATRGRSGRASKTARKPSGTGSASKAQPRKVAPKIRRRR